MWLAIVILVIMLIMAARCVVKKEAEAARFKTRFYDSERKVFKLIEKNASLVSKLETSVGLEEIKDVLEQISNQWDKLYKDVESLKKVINVEAIKEPE